METKDQIDGLNNSLIEAENRIKTLYGEIREWQVKHDEAERKAIKWDRYYKEIFGRHRNQLMTAYYMLEKLQEVGTHHEKEVVIRYIRMVLKQFMEGDSLPIDEDILPF